MKLTNVLLLLFLVLMAGSVQAAPALTIISGDQKMVFDRQELENFPQTTISTTSPYFEGTMDFTGPTLARVLEAFGIRDESQIRLKALNDYAVAGTLEEVLGLEAIVATRRNTEIMSVRNHGPFWVILPLSDRPELDNQDFHKFMIWQLDRIELD
ncbi:MAG: hypothetical protein EP339_03450 [Gammaproteobacteria bacterium]|nr:MAG: hypothetical protein EP339_03450 [Gammaproteobacteria bacterium]TNF01245.1 MAG: hypothetical protein EP328_00280 [Gammaproteobacteria bacterium]